MIRFRLGESANIGMYASKTPRDRSKSLFSSSIKVLHGNLKALPPQAPSHFHVTALGPSDGMKAFMRCSFTAMASTESSRVSLFPEGMGIYKKPPLIKCPWRLSFPLRKICSPGLKIETPVTHPSCYICVLSTCAELWARCKRRLMEAVNKYARPIYTDQKRAQAGKNIPSKAVVCKINAVYLITLDSPFHVRNNHAQISPTCYFPAAR